MVENCVLVSGFKLLPLSPPHGGRPYNSPYHWVFLAGAKQTVGQILLCLGRAVW